MSGLIARSLLTHSLFVPYKSESAFQFMTKKLDCKKSVFVLKTAELSAVFLFYCNKTIKIVRYCSNLKIFHIYKNIPPLQIGFFIV